MFKIIKKYLLPTLITGWAIGFLTLSINEHVYSAGYGQSGKTSKYDVGDNTEKLSIGAGTVGVFTPAKLSTADGDKTVRAVCQTEGADMRITWDGTTPSATVGLKITDGSHFQIVGDANITNFSTYILTGSGSGDIYVMYEKETEMNKTTFGE